MLRQSVLHKLIPTVFTSTRGLPSSLPGPAPSRFLGTAGPMRQWGADPLGYARTLFERYGDVVALVRGGGVRCISSDPSCPGTVLTYGASNTETATTLHETFGKGALSGPLHPGAHPSLRERPLLTFGAGLFAVNGQDHRRHRRLLMPAFSKARLDSYRDQMVGATEAELALWQPNSVRDVAIDMRRLTLNIVSAAMFGRTEGVQGERASDELQAALRLMGLPLTRVIPRDVPGLPFHRFLDAVKLIEDQVRGIIEEKRTAPDGAEDMLSALLRATDDESGTTLTEDELIGHVSVIFTAGHETSSNALTWTLFLLGMFPAVAARLREELTGRLSGEAPSVEQLEQLPYLDAVVKESLRLMPPAPWNGRVLREPAVLGGHELPVGAEVLVSIYETHRVPELYADPLAFRPERWETLKPSVYEYNPFSAGQRICIGARFAVMEIKIVLAMLLQRYQLQVRPQRVDRFAEMVLTPRDGMQVLVLPATRSPAPVVPVIRGNVREMVRLPTP